jgi:hypothetical protein
MDPEGDEVRFRAHVKQLREATRGIGKDVEVEFKDIERGIAKLPHTVGRDYDHLRDEIDLKLLRLAVRAHKFRKDFPKAVEADLKRAGHAAKTGAKVAVEAPIVYGARAARSVKKHGQRGFSKAAGTYHPPINEWDRKSGSSDSSQ